ncbi:MAG: hypothetical protein M1157_02955, partial [Deinococcus sp.]|nr:hypothetical protein [Deinococcus sp.]
MVYLGLGVGERGGALPGLVGEDAAPHAGAEGIHQLGGGQAHSTASGGLEVEGAGEDLPQDLRKLA